jgi:hypothetical protein
MAIVQKGTWWREHRTGAGGETLRGVVRAGSRWVFVGDTSLAPLIVTLDATVEEDNLPPFVTRTPAGSDFLRDVGYVATGATLAACGDNGVVESSTDQGATWSSLNVAGSPHLYGIVAKSGDALSRFVAVGVNEIWGQDNTATWTQRWSGSQTWRSVGVRVGHRWVAVGDNGWASESSTGGVGTWSAPFNFGIGNLIKCETNANYFLALSHLGYLYRSTTGVSGSWTQIHNFSETMAALVPVLTTGAWVAFSAGTKVFYSADDGDTWTRNDGDVTQGVLDAYNISGGPAIGCGYIGSAQVSYGQVQSDPPDLTPQPETPPAFSANDDMAGDAVRRIISQFRSGRG